MRQRLTNRQAKELIAGQGDCYEAAGNYMINKGIYGGKKGLKLVHGEVSGQGPLEGISYGHAWVEDGSTVIDKSNGNDLQMPKALYYKIGKIDENDNVHKYTIEQMRRKILSTEHWGPWDLKTKSGL